MDRTAKSRMGVATLALVGALVMFLTLSGVARADDPPGAGFHVTGTATTLTGEGGESFDATIISTVVNLDFGDALLPAGIDPSSITVTVNGVPLDFTKHAFTFNHRRLTVTIEEWRVGAVSETELNQRRSGNVSVSYAPPADAEGERLRYGSGGDVGAFAVTAAHTSEDAAAASFVTPAEPKTVTATIRGNASPTKSQTVIVGPASTANPGTSTQAGEDLTDVVRGICQQLGGSDCRWSGAV